VDKAGFIGEIPEIYSMSAYEPFNFFIVRKLFLHNMGHAITAYLGYSKGYEYIWQAAEDPDIELRVLRAMVASGAALAINYDQPFYDLYLHIEDLLRRFKNKKLGDTIYRIGRDLKRKLSPEDRLIGAIKNCRDAGVSPDNIYPGIACALKFAAADSLDMEPGRILKEICGLDENSGEYRRILALYTALEPA